MGTVSPLDPAAAEAAAPEEGLPLEERRLEERRAEGASAARTADGAAPAPTLPAPARALLEVIDRDGHVRQVWPIRAWPARIGRALDNDVVLTDPHVAAHHLKLEDAGGGVLVMDTGETVNGVTVGTRRVGAGMRATLALEGEPLDLGVGRTRLRLRLAETVLAPEVPLAGLQVRHPRLLPSLALAVLVVAGVAFGTYLDSDPDNFVRTAGSTLLVGLTAAALWCGAWALLSKTITRQGHFGWHLRVFVIAALALLALNVLPGLVAFALSWPWLTDFSFIATFAVGAAALYFHLLGIEPARPRRLRWVVATGAVVAVALTLWFNQQRTSRIGDELYMSHLYPPALRIARPLPADRFIDGLGSLRALLDRKAKEPASAADFGDSRGGRDDEE